MSTPCIQDFFVFFAEQNPNPCQGQTPAITRLFAYAFSDFPAKISAPHALRTHSLSARQAFPDFPGKHLRRTRFVRIASPQARTFRTFLGKYLRRVFSKSNSFFRYCMFMECLANIFSPAGLLFTCKKRAKSCILYRLEEETHVACLKRFGARVFLSQKRNERSKDMDSVPDGKNTTKVKLHSLAFACFA